MTERTKHRAGSVTFTFLALYCGGVALWSLYRGEFANAAFSAAVAIAQAWAIPTRP